MAWLSRELGRNHAYMQQFMVRHTPHDLELQDKLRVAKLLAIPLDDLGVDLDIPAPLQPAGGLSEEAETYTPPPGSFLATSPDVAYFRATSDSLDRHPLAICKGDVVVASIRDGVLDEVASGDAVVVQIYHKPDCMTATTVLRQYVAPGLLITNSSGANSIWRMDDDSLPFEPVIKARVVSVIRATN